MNYLISEIISILISIIMFAKIGFLDLGLISDKLVQYWKSCRRELNLSRDFKATCLLPFGGPAISEPLLIFDAKKIVIVDNGSFGIDFTYKGEDSYLRKEGLWLESTIDKFGIVPILKYELGQIGAENLKVQLHLDRVLIKFNWKHPESEIGEDREILILKHRIPEESTKVSNAVKRCNVGILKGYMFNDPDSILDYFLPDMKQAIFLVAANLLNEYPRNSQEIGEVDLSIQADQRMRVVRI